MRYLVKLFMLLLMVPANLAAQDRGEKTSDFSYFLADLSYMSDAVFMGRRDSIKAPYAYATFGYYDKSGFFGTATASYLVASEEQRFDLFQVSAGYLYSKNDLSAGLSATKFFFNDESYNVQSEIEAGVTGMLAYDFDLAELTLSASGYFSDNDSPDVFLNLMIDQTFFAFEKDLMFTPTLMVGAGTQYFYEEYYNSSRLGNRKGQGNGPGSGMQQSQDSVLSISEASNFNVLNIEARLPFLYFYKSFIFSFTPMLSFPQSGTSIRTIDTMYEEDLDSVFYWSAGISYWFRTGK